MMAGTHIQILLKYGVCVVCAVLYVGHYGFQPFFRGKPTWRGLKTQHPYLSDFIGEPYVSFLSCVCVRACCETLASNCKSRTVISSTY